MTDSPPPGVFALIPAYNEAERLAPVVVAAAARLPVLVVDDGSRDATAEVAARAGARVARQIPNAGKGAALRRGFREVMALGARAAVTLDADGQHDPAEIPAFLAAWERTGADLVIGARDFRAMPPVRRLSNAFARAAFSWAMGRPILDNQSGYRLVSRRLMEAVLASHEAGFEFEVEMIACCAERGYGLSWVPIRTIYAGEKSHIRPVAHTAGFLRLVLATRRRMGRARRRGA
jgi:glycosyltransferase involved in cell wall biosynthesis